MRTVAASRFLSIRGDADAWRLTRRSACDANARCYERRYLVLCKPGVVRGLAHLKDRPLMAPVD